MRLTAYFCQDGENVNKVKKFDIGQRRSTVSYNLTKLQNFCLHVWEKPAEKQNVLCNSFLIKLKKKKIQKWR